MQKQYYIYILANASGRVLYVGVTNDLKRRVYEHKTKSAEGFTSRYNISKLVYYEVCEDAYTAISREKQIKGGSREDKVHLVRKMNQSWTDLYESL